MSAQLRISRKSTSNPKQSNPASSSSKMNNSNPPCKSSKSPASRPSSEKSFKSYCKAQTSQEMTTQNKSKTPSNDAIHKTASILNQKTSSFSKKATTTPEALLKSLKIQADRAIKERKTFTVMGNYNAVRRALLNRGWLEKVHPNFNQCEKDDWVKFLSMSGQELAELLNNKAYIEKKNIVNVIKRIILSKFLVRNQVDFFWHFGIDPFKINPDNVKLTIINCIKKGNRTYSSKQGLCESLKQSHWYNCPGKSVLKHPRSYNLSTDSDTEEFVRDFKMTAAMSLLKWIIHIRDNSVSKLMSHAGTVSVEQFYFALEECEKIIKRGTHEDIDDEIEDGCNWDKFLDSYYRCVHIGAHFKPTSTETEHSLAYKSKIMLAELLKIWPYLDMDGYMNVWILKPVNGSRGLGIHMCRTLNYVLKVVGERKNMKYIVQKYIERPLLIYNTKFDIRQWFLISCTSPLTIWIFKKCYLRFSSQTYNLRKLHESIHLTNNSVQCKYNSTNRDPELPDHNMWDSERFRKYLNTIGHLDAYDDIIYPGMKQCIMAAVLSHQESLNTRRNSFELYGADFMLTEDFTPWLIEINSRPALYASTPVTAKMCPQVLEDTVKVVIDRTRNSKSSTGHFELLYKEEVSSLPPLDPTSFVLHGFPLPPNYFFTPPIPSYSQMKKHKTSNVVNIRSGQNYIQYVSDEMKRTLKALLDVIRKENKRRMDLRLHNQTSQSMSAMEQKHSVEYADKIKKVNETVKEIQKVFGTSYAMDEKTGLVRNLDEENGINEVVTVDFSCYNSKSKFSEEVMALGSYLSENKEKLDEKSDERLKYESGKIEQCLRTISTNTDQMTSILFENLMSFLKIWTVEDQTLDNDTNVRKGNFMTRFKQEIK